MEIDVIIPLYKPGKELFTLLDKLGSQSVPVHQVILLNTEEKYFDQLIYGIRFLETYQNIKVYHVSKREFDHGGTRRIGVKKSSADVFVMMTQDAMPKDDRLIEKLVEPLQGEVAVAYARQLPREDSTPVESYTREFNYPAKSRIKSAADLDSLGIKTFFCSNVCAAYRREIYEELGGFVRHTIFNEDMRQRRWKQDTLWLMRRMRRWCILIIIPTGSSSTETLTWEYRRQSTPRFLQHILRSPRENEW